MKKIVKQAFTLIELLVVIAIIGILSGLIVVAMGGVIDKANIAKSQVFSNSLKNSLMLGLVSEWKFDEGSGQTSSDLWGGNNGTLGGTASVESSDPTWITSGCPAGSCLSFDGGDYILVLDNASLDNMNHISIFAWVKTSTSGEMDVIEKLQYYVAGIQGYGLVVYNGGLNYHFCTSFGCYNTLKGSGITDGKWHYIGYTYDGSNINSYIDGKNLGTQAATGTMQGNTLNLNIGKRSASTYYFTGLIDEPRVFNEATSISKIKEQYYTGLNNLLINGGINKEEYISRINTLAIK